MKSTLITCIPKKWSMLFLLIFASLHAKSDLYINEISGNDKWIELYNSGDVAVNLSNHILQKIDEFGISQNWTIPSGTIPAKGFISWTQGTSIGTTFTWGISAKKDVIFKLFTPAADGRQLLDQFIVHKELYSEGLARTVGRKTDGAEELVIFKNGGTKGTSNNAGTVQTPTPVGDRKNLYVNEIDGNEKWFEIYNAEDTEVDLTNFSIQKINETGDIDNWFFPNGTKIPAKGFRSWTRDAYILDNSTFTWGISARKDVAFKIFDFNGTQLDYFEVREDLYSQGLNRTVGRKTDGTEEIILFKNGGTKGASNNTGTAQTPTPVGDRKTLYVNEISGNEKWLEIYNAEDVEVDLTNYFVRKIDEVGIADHWFIPTGTKIAAKGFRYWTQNPDCIDGSTFTWGISARKDVSFKIFDPDGAQLDYFEIRSDLYSEGGVQTVGRQYDGASTLVIFETGTPGASNGPVGIASATFGDALSAYVNSGILYLSDDVTSVSVVSILGASILAQETVTEKEINISYLSSGVYLVQMSNSNHQTKTQKIVLGGR